MSSPGSPGLDETERRYASIYAVAPFGIVLTRVADQTVVTVNDAFLELFACRREDIVGKNSVSAGLLSAAEREGLLARLKAEGRVRNHELVRAVGRDTPQALTVHVDLITIDGQPMMLTTLVDITREWTERRRLVASEGRYRALFEQSAIGVVEAEAATGRIFEANERFCAMIGYARDELRALSWRALTHPEDLERNIVELQQHLSLGRPYRTEKRYLRKDGSILWARLTVTPMRLIDTQGQTILSLIEDITEQRQVTEQFHQAQKLESIGRLAGGVAHDFNNLLTVILSCSENLQLDLAEGRPPDVEDVKEISLAGQRAQELTRHLLAFARRQFIEPVDLSLNAVVESSQKMLVRLVGEDVRLVSQLAPDLWRTWADRGQLEQVLVNLAVNARDAMPRGGTLRFQTENRTIPAGHAQAGDWVVLAVSDTGHGMSDEVKAHLFEPFFTTKAQGKGTGLGLATVYGIVTGAGGHVLVHSALDVGTTIEVLLPRTHRRAEPRNVATPRASTRGTEAVLVVEDEPQVREVTLRTLRSAGYEVLGAAGPLEALALPPATLARVQLLVTDVVMPDLDGRALADQLRARYPKLKVLFVSGYAIDVIADRSGLQPGTDLLGKPFNAATLLARVRATLDG